MPTLSEVIAERVLVLEGSPIERVTVRLGKPYPANEGAEYRCPYQIVGYGKEVNRYGAGIDAFQSVRVALHMIGAEVARLNMNAATRLKWPEGSHLTNCGFGEA
jgi:hypothetical protein